MFRNASKHPLQGGETVASREIMATVQSTVDTGHEDMVHDAQMDYYGTRLATCSSDKLVKIFEVKDGTQVLLENVVS